MIKLYKHQIDAINEMRNGCVLVGGMGSGKSLTALAYYYIKVCDGKLRIDGETQKSEDMKNPRNLVIITTAKKRDTNEWEMDLAYLNLQKGENSNGVTIEIDSWNNIKKYKDHSGCMFIFDEQHIKGSGAWVKTFLNIARKNQWILLSATPGDTWTDYIPVFVANGFYKNKSDFTRRHCVYSRFAKYPKIERYVDEGILLKYRRMILVKMNYEKHTTGYDVTIPCDYDKTLYKTVWRDRWDPYDNCPIQETGKLFYLLRKVVNDDASRSKALRDIIKCHMRVIVFYNHKYELVQLRRVFDKYRIVYGEWNGEVHTPIPSGDKWGYLVQYTAGCEGWNCTSTNVIVFYSLNYSYSTMLQAKGRIDRLNTPYDELWYYHFKSAAPIDLAIARALKQKKNFNEKDFNGK